MENLINQSNPEEMINKTDTPTAGQSAPARITVPDENSTDEERQAYFRAIGVPESPDKYDITCSHQLLSSDPEVNAMLHQMGFTNKQVQAVYDLAATKILPVIEELAADYESDKQRDALIRHFGGLEQWESVSRQISMWAKSHVPEPVLNALAGTYEGVMTLYTMMQKGGEPALMREDAASTAVLDEAALQKLMMDPKYWKEQDPETVRKVTEGFQRLYPNSK